MAPLVFWEVVVLVEEEGLVAMLERAEKEEVVAGSKLEIKTS